MVRAAAPPPHPRGTAARAHARSRGGRAARRPERIAARARRAHRACAPPCRRLWDRRRGGQGAGRRAQDQRDPHHAIPKKCVQRRPSPPRGTAARARAVGACVAPPEHSPHALAAPTARAPRVPQTTTTSTTKLRLLPSRASSAPTRRGRPHQCAVPSPPAATPLRDLPRCLDLCPLCTVTTRMPTPHQLARIPAYCGGVARVPSTSNSRGW